MGKGRDRRRKLKVRWNGGDHHKLSATTRVKAEGIRLGIEAARKEAQQPSEERVQEIVEACKVGAA